MKRLLVALVVMAALLAGCGGSGNQAETARMQTQTCKDNLRTLDGSIMQYAAGNSGIYPTSLSVLVPGYIKTMPSCPAGGAYTLKGSSSSTMAVCPNGHAY